MARSKSIWETISAFSNINGGWIVLGVRQVGTEFEISGAGHPEKLELDFLNSLKGGKMNVPVVTKQEVLKKENYLKRERSLLYVAVSRAIENVEISGVGSKSELITI